MWSSQMLKPKSQHTSRKRKRRKESLERWNRSWMSPRLWRSCQNIFRLKLRCIWDAKESRNLVTPSLKFLVKTLNSTMMRFCFTQSPTTYPRTPTSTNKYQKSLASKSKTFHQMLVSWWLWFCFQTPFPWRWRSTSFLSGQASSLAQLRCQCSIFTEEWFKENDGFFAGHFRSSMNDLFVWRIAISTSTSRTSTVTSTTTWTSSSRCLCSTPTYSGTLAKTFHLVAPSRFLKRTMQRAKMRTFLRPRRTRWRLELKVKENEATPRMNWKVNRFKFRKSKRSSRHFRWRKSWRSMIGILCSSIVILLWISACTFEL